LPPERSDAEFHELADRLYARVTAELLLAAHTDSEVAGGELLDHFRSAAGSSRPPTAKKRAAAAGHLVAVLLSTEPQTAAPHDR